MNIATTAFATLGHAGRLSVFRLLMRHMPQGVRPTEIAAALDISLAALLKQIDAARGRRPLASACRLHALEWVAQSAPVSPQSDSV